MLMTGQSGYYQLYIKYMQQVDRQQRIKSIINTLYYSSFQTFYLDEQEKYWQQILVSRDWSMLKALFLQQNEINDENIEIVLNMDWLSLQDLYLSCKYKNIDGNKLTVKGVQKLMNKKWPKLNNINLSENSIHDEGLITILQNQLNILTSIQLFGCGISQNGIKMMASCNTTNLKHLTLGNNCIGNLGAKWLAKSYLPALQLLYIADCGIMGEGVRALVKSQWKQLARIWWSQQANQSIYPYIGEQNKIQLQGWQKLYENNWIKLKQLTIQINQPICGINLVLMPKTNTKIEEYKIWIQNDELSSLYKQILKNRNLLNSQLI